MSAITFKWDGTAMTPLERNRRLACAEFAPGKLYTLEEVKTRSRRSHDHFFAVVDELYQTLPEGVGDNWPTSEHMRKHLLIRSGHCDVQTVVCQSRAEALRWAAVVRPLDEYAIVDVRDAVVTIYRAKSQSLKAMGAQDFQKSKTAVLERLCALLGVKTLEPA